MTTNEIIRLENIRRNFIVGSETVHALRGVNFTINSGEFALQSDFIHFGDELSFGYDGVVVGIQFVDDTRYLCPDFDLCDRLDCSGCRDGFRDVSSYSLSRFDNIVRALRLPAETEPEYCDGFAQFETTRLLRKQTSYPRLTQTRI